MLTPRPVSILLALLVSAVCPLAAAEPVPATPPPEMAQAVEKARSGDLPAAIALLEPLRAAAAAHPAAMALLGDLYLQARRPEDALALLAPLADGGAAGPAILRNAGRAALALGQTDKAAAYLRRSVDKAPTSPAARELGMLLGSEGRAAESYELLRPWAKAHPEDGEARLAAAYDAVDLNRPPEAEELLSGLPADAPRARLLRGRLQILQRKPRQGVATLEPLLSGGIPELDLQVRRALAEAHLALGEAGASIDLLQGKTGADPSLALLLGRAQYQAGRPEDAVAILAPLAADPALQEPATGEERALAAGVALEYGRALVALARWPAAVAALERATRLAPESVQAWQVLIQAQLGAGRRDDAARSSERFRALEKAQPGVSQQVQETERGQLDPTRRNLDRAAALLAEGKRDEALAAIRQEAALAPDDPRPRAAEVSALRQILKAHPDDLTALGDLANLLAAQGNKDEARGLLKKILALRPGDPAATARLRSLDAPR